MPMGRDRGSGVDVQQVQAGVLGFQQDLRSPEIRPFLTQREVFGATANLHRGALRAPEKSPGFFQANLDL